MSDQLAVGQVLGGRFEVEALLGAGGTAQVYRVRHRTLGSVHAVKVLHASSPSLVARLIQEGRIQAQLRHPNVVAVNDVLEHEGGIGLVMEFVDGESLEALLARQRFSADEALDLFVGVLAGVRVAHAAGVLHRDIKPANILVRHEGGRLFPKVTDFGIAKIAVSEPGEGERPLLIGTPGYIAPEIIDGQPPGPRADVFALGVLLFELIAGIAPFDRGSVTATLGATKLGDTPDLAELAPHCPAPIVDAVMQALRTDPAERLADCDAFAAALALGAPTRFAPQPQASRGRIDLPEGARSPTLYLEQDHARPHSMPTMSEYMRGDTPPVVGSTRVPAADDRDTRILPAPQPAWWQGGGCC